MSRDRKILWSEGMFLSPHHFQQWDHEQEENLRFRLNSLVSFAWGLTEIKVNREGLLNGQFALLSCRGALPGGLRLDIPENDMLPASRPIEGHFPAAADCLEVYLGVPVHRAGAANVHLEGIEGPKAKRYRSELVRVTDEVSGENERDIAIARKNIRVLFGDEPLIDCDHLKIAEIRRTPQGSLALDETYIPPSLQLHASKYLMEMVLRLLEILHAKSGSLGETRGQRTRGLAEFGTSDVANFWLLHTVNHYIPLLDHYYRVGSSHPEQLFLILAQLAGELITFSPTAHPRDIPKYDHLNLKNTFVTMDQMIQELLKTVIPTGAVQIPLNRESESKFTAKIVDDQLILGAQLFLAATAEIPEGQLITEVPQQAKISSIDKIESLLGLALPGVPLIHRSVPPSPMRVKLGYQYFRLEDQGGPEIQQHLEAIRSSRTIAIRIPNPKRFAGLKLELWSIKD
jgi:type VI secretion system protein ImpJ